MAASIIFDQTGLPAGTGGSRSDGLNTGATVTVTNASGQPCRCEFWWVPPDDAGVEASLAQIGPTQWSFDPDPGIDGEYIVRMVEAEGTENETEDIKRFGIRLPVSGLLVPGLNSRGDFSINLASTAGEKTTAAAISFANEGLAADASIDWANWWEQQSELYDAVEALAAAPSGGQDGVNVFVWEPLYAGSSPNVYSTFQLAFNAAAAADGPAIIKLQIGASAVFSIPNAVFDGEGNIMLEAPDSVSSIQISLGDSCELLNFRGVIGSKTGFLEFLAPAAGPNGACFRFTQPGLMPVFKGGVGKAAASVLRALVKFEWGAPLDAFREIYIGQNALINNAGDIESDGALRIHLFEPNASVVGQLVQPVPAHSEDFEVHYWFDYPLDGATIASAWTGTVTEVSEQQTESMTYDAATPANWPEFGGFPQRLDDVLDALGGRTLVTTARGVSNTETITPASVTPGSVTVDLPNLDLSFVNISIGNDARGANLLGGRVICIGYNAMAGGAGGDLIAIGPDVMGLAGGGNSIVMGAEVLEQATAGVNDSVVIGHRACISPASTIDQSVIIGRDAGPGSGTGTFNALTDDRLVLIGYRAGEEINNASATRTVMVGSITGSGVIFPDDVVFVGHNAYADATCDDVISIGNSCSSGAQFNVAIGGAARCDAGVIQAVAVGHAAQADADNTVAIGQGADATAVDAIAMGQASAAAGLRAVAIGADAAAPADDAIALGFAAAVNALALGAIAIGENSDALAGGIGGIAIGSESAVGGTAGIGIGEFVDTGTGSGGVFVGRSSGNVSASGAGNTVLGQQSGQALTTGASNVMVGDNAGNTTTTGSNNVLIGTGVSAPAAGDSNFINVSGHFIGDSSTGRSAFDPTGLGVLATQAAHFGIYSGENDDVAVMLLDNQGGTNGTDILLFTGTRADPNTAVTAPVGSLYISSNGTGALWQNTNGATAWSQLGTGGGGSGTLQDAYDNGNAIVTDGAGGTLDVSGTEAISLVSSAGNITLSNSASGTADILINAGDTLDLNAGGAFTLDADSIVMNSAGLAELISSTADTTAVLALETTGTNGADVSLFVGNRDPNTNVTGAIGDHYLSTTGTGSLWRSTTAGTVWRQYVDMSADGDISGINTFVFDAEFDNGNVSGAVNIDFATNGQKQRMTMIGNVTGLDFTFPSSSTASGFVLFIEQDVTGSRTVAFANGSTKQAGNGGQLEVGDAGNSVTMMNIHWDGSMATITTIPNLTASPTVSLV